QEVDFDHELLDMEDDLSDAQDLAVTEKGQRDTPPASGVKAATANIAASGVARDGQRILGEDANPKMGSDDLGNSGQSNVEYGGDDLQGSRPNRKTSEFVNNAVNASPERVDETTVQKDWRKREITIGASATPSARSSDPRTASA
ncbi:unnamed protein product, partial [Sphacelaria rigidula]